MLAMCEEEEVGQDGFFQEKHVFVVTPQGTCHKLAGLLTTSQATQSPPLLPLTSPPPLHALRVPQLSPPPTTSPPPPTIPSPPPTTPPPPPTTPPPPPPPTTSPPPPPPPTPMPLQPPPVLTAPSSHSAASAAATRRMTEPHMTGKDESSILNSNLNHSSPQHAMPPLLFHALLEGRGVQAGRGFQAGRAIRVDPVHTSIHTAAVLHQQTHSSSPASLLTPAQSDGHTCPQLWPLPESAQAAITDERTAAAAMGVVPAQHAQCAQHAQRTQRAQSQQNKGPLLNMHDAVVPNAVNRDTELTELGQPIADGSWQQQSRLQQGSVLSLDILTVGAFDVVHSNLQAQLTEDQQQMHQGRDQPQQGSSETSLTQSTAIGTGKTATGSAQVVPCEGLLSSQTAAPATAVALNLNSLQAEEVLSTRLDAVRQDGKLLSNVVPDEVSAAPEACVSTSATLQHPSAAVIPRKRHEPTRATGTGQQHQHTDSVQQQSLLGSQKHVHQASAEEEEDWQQLTLQLDGDESVSDSQYMSADEEFKAWQSSLLLDLDGADDLHS